jgi:hypothetical protein
MATRRVVSSRFERVMLELILLAVRAEHHYQYVMEEGVELSPRQG